MKELSSRPRSIIRQHWVAGFSLVVSFFFLHAGLAFAADSLERIRARGTLIWGGDQEGGAPFVFPSPDDPNKVLGSEVELAQLIASHLGVKAEFFQGPWDKLPDLLTRGDIDLVLDGYEWTPARGARYGSTIPYYIYDLQLLSREDDATLLDWDDLRTRDGKKRRVAVLGGSAAQEYLEKHRPDDVEIVAFDGVTDAMRAVELGADGIDANLQDSPIWIYYRHGFPGLKAAGEPVGQGFYVGLVRREDTELLREINKAILMFLQDGSLQTLLVRYQLWNAKQEARALATDPEGRFLGSSSASARGDTSPSREEIAPVEAELYVAERGWLVLRRRGWILIKAAGMTAILAVLAMPLAILAGMSLAILRLYGPRFAGMMATAWVEIIRGTPLVLQLYVLFFLFPEIGISIPAFWSSVLGLAINYSAYEAEIYRAGLQAVPIGQMEAALSLGMSRKMALRRVILPQATRIVIPPVTNDFIALFKDTAVCSVISVVELSKQYYMQARSTGAIVELGILTALLYMLMSYPLSLIAAKLERQMARTDRR
jgi:polar amino acid transport system substrate-binding protein